MIYNVSFNSKLTLIFYIEIFQFIIYVELTKGGNSRKSFNSMSVQELLCIMIGFKWDENIVLL